MAEKVMVKGNEAMGEAAVRAGCRLYFGYPITPQSELTEYMSRRLPEVEGTFLQSESEVAAVNMIYGAASTGTRVMTSTSSPGFSLMQEGISYIAGAELPSVFINVVRGGPGLGDIQPAQSDYFQGTKGGGHGDYHLIVLAPSSVQEAVDLVQLAFDLADKYRNPVLVLADGMLGQMMEPVEFPEFRDLNTLPDHSSWAMQGCEGREPHKITSFDIDPINLEKMNLGYQKKYREIEANEVRYETEMIEDAEYLLVGYGTMARILGTVVKMARNEGIKVGLFRPITLWPFPYKELESAAEGKKALLTVEMSMGQMVEDVRLAINGKMHVDFYGRTGGVVPTPEEVLRELKKIVERSE
ncbi:MAG: 3-methyl-2-oxobutanoate dehydrogenase subunit beta [Thermotogae bacterium]|uniref:3-methyl-2-oxobutanoate dehydrogenase subunit VorB n=1 Tax=Kosmotoga sp. TaxID=1955248 RepID=UPI000F22EAE4|nr:3-methyl-2-oxobutanoate dehydrogenase subunit VorB [Kosmotoga sp.]MBO8166240.1 3-methyl-2-oxobutanoate dehydrogenase subunit VorB [Kosmotoga sp.]MCD6159466.1 3-methyl-2-oxobutanoate dehydrogenase subunit VorB [Kosmotoga sp.]RKX50665.1 MAG: 3-methyl-2-oxobutanoate dehydrogenase subunit beta [Thermotogota bacterium]